MMLSLTTLKGIGLAGTLRETARQGWSVGDIRAALVANAGEEARGAEKPLWRSGAMYLAGIAALLAFWVGPREAVLSTLTVGPLVLVTELFALLMPVALGRWFGARLDGVKQALARLRERAAQLHRQDERFSAALAEVGGTGDARREGVRRELEEEQRSTRAALGETVATLDALRLDLLRLRAGTMTAKGMTELLETVRRVGAEVDARLEALRELRQP